MPGYIVKLKTTVVKEIVCDAPSESEAHNDPLKYAVSENEIETIDWKVMDVREND